MLKLKINHRLIECGTDEAGRGCLAGPVTAAAVILPDNFKNNILTDSKQLSEKKRKLLRLVIEEQSISFSVAHVMMEKIDRLNILNASILAMHKSINSLIIKPQHIAVDGNRFKPLSELEEMTGTSKEALVVFAENVENVNKAVENMNSSLTRHSDMVNANDQIKNTLGDLSDAIKANDKNLMLNLSKEISNLSNGLSKSIKDESTRLGKSIAENSVVTSAKLNKEFEKLIKENKKTQNTKLLKELSNSTSSLNAALEAIASQNKMLVREISDQKESITFP